MTSIVPRSKTVVAAQERKSWDEITRIFQQELTANAKYPALVRQPLKDLKAKFSKMEESMAAAPDLPLHYGKLNDHSKSQVIDMMVDIKEMQTALKKAEEYAKNLVHGHLDSVYQGPERGRHKDGWLLAEDKTSFSVASRDRKIIRTCSKPSLSVSDRSLQKLEQDGVINHEDYLQMTIPVREVDEQAVVKKIAERGQSFLDALTDIADSKIPTITIRVSPNK